MNVICNPQTSAPQTTFMPRSKPWDSLELLGGLDRGSIRLSDPELAEHAELLEYDMNTEYDAENFCKFLEKLEARGLTFSEEFRAFERAWRRDEWNHYVGYRRLYSMATGEHEDALHHKVTTREVDFSSIEHFFEDEFSVCVVLAYDEVFTARSCQLDFKLFASFGPPAFLAWIKRVARDESFHFLNVVEVVRRRHAHRIPEAAGILDSLIKWDALGQRTYTSTFVLDHSEDRFSPQVLENCKMIVLRHLA